MCKTFYQRFEKLAILFTDPYYSVAITCNMILIFLVYNVSGFSIFLCYGTTVLSKSAYIKNEIFSSLLNLTNLL